VSCLQFGLKTAYYRIFNEERSQKVKGKKYPHIFTTKILLPRFASESFFWIKIWGLSFHAFINNVEMNFLGHLCYWVHSTPWRECTMACHKHEHIPHET
jgi:hypothetical protein